MLKTDQSDFWGEVKDTAGCVFGTLLNVVLVAGGIALCIVVFNWCDRLVKILSP